MMYLLTVAYSMIETRKREDKKKAEAKQREGWPLTRKELTILTEKDGTRKAPPPPGADPVTRALLLIAISRNLLTCYLM